MNHKYLAVLMLLITVLASGCRKNPPPSSSGAPRWDDPVSEQHRQLHELTLAIQVARDSAAEADAIRAFQEYLRRNSLIYTVNTYRVNEDTHIAAPSIQPYPVRAIVDVFYQRERIHQFVFIPKDNQNLALLIA